MIIGAHSIIYSTDAEADRAFLRDVLGFPHADAGGGWLIFGLPPAEVAVHPGEENDHHEFYLMCKDVDALIARMRARGVECSPVHEAEWGRLTQLTLPGGGKLGIYQPLHARPKAAGASKPAAKKASRRAPKKAARKSAKRKPARKASKKKARRR